jgi:hypothetical protein
MYCHVLRAMLGNLTFLFYKGNFVLNNLDLEGADWKTLSVNHDEKKCYYNRYSSIFLNLHAGCSNRERKV